MALTDEAQTAEAFDVRFPRLGVGTRVIRFFAWLLKAKLTHGSLVIVVNEVGEVLLVKQRLRERRHWGPPGGFMSIGESPLQAAVRELREETGIDVDPSTLSQVAEYRQPWAWHYDHLFVAPVRRSAVDLETRSVEVENVGWFGREELPPLTRAAQLALHHWRWAA